MYRYVLCLALASIANTLSAETIEYLIPEEASGAYQSKHFPYEHETSLGMIDRIVLALVEDTDIELQPKIMPAMRVRSLTTSDPKRKWLTFVFIGKTWSARIADSPSESWSLSKGASRFHLASFHTSFWYTAPPAHIPKTGTDLRNSDIVTLTTIGYKELNQWVSQFGLKLVRVKSINHAFKMLASNRVDFAFFSEASARWHYHKLERSADQLHRIKDPAYSLRTEVYLSWNNAISEANQQHFRKTLTDMEKNGRLGSIRLQYRFDPPNKTEQE
ncbi:hypothetical protein R50073_40100 [Maricurvus nonylphenolicus]|uniref:hypothetical protein n=1 Tax=Maricurvus nonylphenolicus TaxID=1008307 RepID=UPI0036F2410A